MNNDGIEYVLRWSEEIDDGFFEDFMSVENAVFGGFSKQILQHKFVNNIYGSCLITIAYLDGEPIGADAMMRNDVFGHIAFETIDTCVTEKCRGKGVFSTITKKEVAEVLAKYPDAIIYGFPNGNSFPGYVKMGWNVQCKLYPAPLLSTRLFDREHPSLIDTEYAKWLKGASSQFNYIKSGKRFYLVKKGKKHFQMIGQIEPEAAALFEREKHPGLVKCCSIKKRFFNNNDYQGSIITYGKIPFDIPYWKTDPLLN